MSALAAEGVTCKGGGKGMNAQAQITITSEAEAETTVANVVAILRRKASSVLA